jgi:transcription initiation factor TFIIB
MHIQKTAIHIAQRADEICNIQGRAPSSIAGAAIYLACLAAGEEQTKKDVQQATAASEGVIRDVYRIMLRHAAELFPSNFDFKCPVSALPVS